MHRFIALSLLFATTGCTPATIPIGDNPATDTATSTDTATTDTSTVDPNLDTDGDGLTDAEEATLGTNPNSADSDGDGYDDAAEVDGNTDPNEAADHPYAGGWAIGDCRDDIASTGNGLGQIAQDFSLSDQYGDRVRLHDFCDREVLLVGAAFW